MTVEDYWGNFKRINNLNDDEKYFDAFSFFDISEEGIERLTKLVIDGKKKATTSAFLEDEEYPHIGSYSIVLNSKNEPVCIIRTTNTRILRLKDMSLQLALKEGESDSLEDWFFDHNLMFEKESQELGYKFCMDMPIFFEEFEVVYKG